MNENDTFDNNDTILMLSCVVFKSNDFKTFEHSNIC